MGVTDCATGEARYFRNHDHDPRWFMRTVLRATCSLPLLSPPVTVQGRPCLDGGLSDSIPLLRSIADGNPRNVVVLTRNAGYRKTPQGSALAGRVLLARHPAVFRALRDRHVRYNASLDLVASLQRAGSAFVLRPVRPLVVGRMERDPASSRRSTGRATKRRRPSAQ